MAKRGRPRKNPLPESIPVQVNQDPPEEIAIQGIAPNQYDLQEELDSMEVDPFHEETARYGRNADDAMGGVGLNFGDW